MHSQVHIRSDLAAFLMHFNAGIDRTALRLRRRALHLTYRGTFHSNLAVNEPPQGDRPSFRLCLPSVLEKELEATTRPHSDLSVCMSCLRTRRRGSPAAAQGHGEGRIGEGQGGGQEPDFSCRRPAETPAVRLTVGGEESRTGGRHAPTGAFSIRTRPKVSGDVSGVCFLSGLWLCTLRSKIAHVTVTSSMLACHLWSLNAFLFLFHTFPVKLFCCE